MEGSGTDAEYEYWRTVWGYLGMGVGILRVSSSAAKKAVHKGTVLPFSVRRPICLPPCYAMPSTRTAHTGMVINLRRRPLLG
eukprot:815555-Rhodomonas_salina.1